MTSPLFSVILPTRSRPGSLQEAIASVLAQTVDDFELIVVDDGGDPAATVPDDRRIQLVHCETSGGPAVARNRGLDVGTGRYIAFLDDDDLYVPERLEIALEGLSRAPVALCWTRFRDRDPGSHRVLEGNVADTILDQSTPSLGATAATRGAVTPFDERWRSVEDIDWWLRNAQKAAVTTVPQIGYLCRSHSLPGHDQRLAERVIENLDFFKAHREYFDAHPRAAAFRWKRVGLLALATGDRRLARTAFVRSLAKRPSPAALWHLGRATMPVGAT